MRRLIGGERSCPCSTNRPMIRDGVGSDGTKVIANSCLADRNRRLAGPGRHEPRQCPAQQLRA